MTETRAVPSGDELRARRRRRTADDIERSALALFAERGFDAVTVEEVAADAGVSERTFFRYFPTKESVLLRDQERRIDHLHQVLAEQPDNLPVLAAVRSAFLAMARRYQDERELVARWAAIVAGTPEVRSRLSGYPAAFSASVTAAVATRLGVGTETDLRPAVMATALLTASYVAYERWLTGGGVDDLPTMVDQALDVVCAGLTATVEDLQRTPRGKRGRRAG